jgi:hypothetical protein
LRQYVSDHILNADLSSNRPGRSFMITGKQHRAQPQPSKVFYGFG